MPFFIDNSTHSFVKEVTRHTKSLLRCQCVCACVHACKRAHANRNLHTLKVEDRNRSLIIIVKEETYSLTKSKKICLPPSSTLQLTAATSNFEESNLYPELYLQGNLVNLVLFLSIPIFVAKESTQKKVKFGFRLPADSTYCSTFYIKK